MFLSVYMCRCYCVLPFLLRNFHRRRCSKNSNSVIVARTESTLHVLKTSLQAVGGDRVRVMGLDEAF